MQSIVNNIYGGANSLAQHSSDFVQSITINTTIQPGDEDALLKGLSAAGVDDQDLELLQRALQQDRDDNDGEQPDKIGPQVRGWLGTWSLKGADMGGKVATSAAGGVVAGLIKQYFHIA